MNVAYVTKAVWRMGVCDWQRLNKMKFVCVCVFVCKRVLLLEHLGGIASIFPDKLSTEK